MKNIWLIQKNISIKQLHPINFNHRDTEHHKKGIAQELEKKKKMKRIGQLLTILMVPPLLHFIYRISLSFSLDA